MRTPWSRAVAGVALLVIVGAGTEARAQYNRRTPIVEAVEKTRAGIVTIKVEKWTGGARKDLVGTGIIVDERGYVITNHHVVTGADRLLVRLSDGTPLTPEVVDEDVHHDLAILRVHAEGALQALPLGPASDVMVGETVIAVGHPFGYTNTVSTGIVSAVGREISMPDGAVLHDLIQTNASVNPGNSGGPLLNVNGEVIGLAVALRDGAQGIAFALNADTVKAVLADRLSALRVAGVRHGLLCRDRVGADGPDHQRAVVEQVLPDSPAQAAGLRRGDEVLRLAGRPVVNRFDVERSLWEHHAGDKIEVTIRRAGGEQVLSVALGAGPREDTVEVRAPGSARHPSALKPARGE